MDESVLKNLVRIWKNPWWWVSLCVGFLVNLPFSMNTEYLAHSLKSWAIGVFLVSFFLAVIGSIYSKGGK